MSWKEGGQGKGDTPRPVNKRLYDKNYIEIFGKKCNVCTGIGLVRRIFNEGKNATHIKCPFCNGTGKVDK